MPEDPRTTALGGEPDRTADLAGALPPSAPPAATMTFGSGHPSHGDGTADSAPRDPDPYATVDAQAPTRSSPRNPDPAATIVESAARTRVSGSDAATGAPPNRPINTGFDTAETLRAGEDRATRGGAAVVTGAAARETTSPIEQRIARARAGGDARAGENSGDRYEYRGIVGQGGMGKVILVHDRDLRRNVAMKLMRSGASARPEFVTRFLEEAQVTGQLEHPNIVPIHEVGVDGRGRVYFTMKHVKGTTLAEVSRRLAEGDEETARHYTLTRLLSIAQQLANALSFAHARGVIHRDLKPDNVMLGAFGEVLIMDWGIAKVVGRRDPEVGDEAHGAGPGDTIASVRSRSGVRTRLGSTLGTPGYMSPEQARGANDTLDGRTDVFALGAILYHLLTGTPPYDQETLEECLGATASGVPIEPPAIRLGRVAPKRKAVIPREVAAITMKALSPDREDRYESAEALAADIQRFLEGRPVLACPDTALQRVVKWAKRNRTVVGASAALLATVLVVGFGVSAYSHRSVVNRLTSEAERAVSSARAQREAALAALAVPAGGADPYGEQAAQRAAGRVEEEYAKQLASAAEGYLRVLDLDPADAGARAALAGTYFELWGTALRRNQPALMDEYARDVARYAGPEAYEAKYRSAIDGDGRLVLTANVEGAEVLLFRYIEVGKWERLVPAPYRLAERRVDEAGLREAAAALEAAGRPAGIRLSDDADFGHRVGVTPLTLDPLPQGSYLLLVRAPGHEDLRLPVMLPRQKDLSVAAELVPSGARPEGFTYVPRVWAKLGGPSAGSKWQSHMWRTVGPFYIQTGEITFGQYEEFLQALLDAGQAAEARRHAPRDFGFTYLEVAGGTLRPHATLGEGWRAWPVRGVSWLDARAYAAWRSRRDGVVYRLPTEDEWEVAARGADGRTYTWGHVFWPEAARLTQGYGMASSGMRALDAGGAAPSDVSPFGVWDMAGSQAEWCQDAFDDRLGEYAIRGNAWALQPIGLETAFRTSGPPDYFHATIGFRLAIDAGVPRVDGHAHEAPPAEKEVRGLEGEARGPEVAPRARPARAAGAKKVRRVARVHSSTHSKVRQPKPASPSRVRPAKRDVF